MKKLIVFLGLMLAFVSANGYCGFGETVLIEKRDDASLPFMFTTEYAYTYDTSQSASIKNVVMEKVSYTGMKDGKVKPYVKLGIYKDQTKSDAGASTVEETSDTEFVYGVGVEGVITKLGNKVTLFGGLDLYYADVDTDETKVNGVVNSITSSVEQFQYTMFLGLGYEIDFGKRKLKPYAGLGYQHNCYDSYSDSGSGSSTSTNKEDDILLFAGLLYEINNKFAVNLEGSYVDSNKPNATIEISVTKQF